MEKGSKNLDRSINTDKSKLKGFVILSAVLLTAIFFSLLALFIHLTKEGRSNVDSSLSPISLSSDPSNVSGGIYYDMVSGFSHTFSNEELSYVKDTINTDLSGSEISYVTYNDILSSISDNSIGTLQFIELNDETGAITAEIMLTDDGVYVEKMEEEGKIYLLSDKDSAGILKAFGAFKILEGVGE